MFGQRRKRKGNECGVSFVVCLDSEVVVHFKLYYKSMFESPEEDKVNCILIYLIFCRMVTSVLIYPKLSTHPDEDSQEPILALNQDLEPDVNEQKAEML